MAIGVLCQEGLSAAQEARSYSGWYIFPTKFLVSATVNVLGADPTRTEASMNSTWYTGLIGSGVQRSNTVLELPCYLPPGLNAGVPTTIGEIYLFAEGKSFTPVYDFATDNSLITIPSELGAVLTTGGKVTLRTALTLPTGYQVAYTYYVFKISSTQIRLCNTKADALAGTNFITYADNGAGVQTIQKEFFLGVGVFDPVSTYNPLDDSIAFRIQLQLASTGDPSLFQFIYSQAQEITDHNLSLTAHPDIQTELNKVGIAIQVAQHAYNGQAFDRLPALGVGVVEGKPVYLDIDGTYKLAQADGTIKELNFVGFYQDGRVKEEGYINIGTHGFTTGQKVYLSTTVAGDLTTTSNNTEVGIVLNSNTIILHKKYFPTVVGGSGVAIQDEGSVVATTSTLNFIGAIVTASGTAGVVNISLASTFTALKDTPASIVVGDANKLVAINNTGDALIFVDPTSNTVPVPTETATGLATIATTVEALAGNNDTKIITPLKLGQVLNNQGVSEVWTKAEIMPYIDWTATVTTVTVNTSTAPERAFYFKANLQDGDQFKLTGTMNATLVNGYVAYIHKLVPDGSTFTLHTSHADALTGANPAVFTTSGTNVQRGQPINTPVRSRNTHFVADGSSGSIHEMPLIADLTLNKTYFLTGTGGVPTVKINATDFTTGTRFFNPVTFTKEATDTFTLSVVYGVISNLTYNPDFNVWEITYK